MLPSSGNPPESILLCFTKAFLDFVLDADDPIMKGLLLMIITFGFKPWFKQSSLGYNITGYTTGI